MRSANKLCMYESDMSLKRRLCFVHRGRTRIHSRHGNGTRAATQATAKRSGRQRRAGHFTSSPARRGLPVLFVLPGKKGSCYEDFGQCKNHLWSARCLLVYKCLQQKKCQINRRTRQRLFLAAGVLSLAIWLFVAAAEVFTPLHAWLHGSTIPVNDDCAVAALAHGKVETAGCAAPAVVPVIWVEIASRIENSSAFTSVTFLPDGRGPPASSFHS